MNYPRVIQSDILNSATAVALIEAGIDQFGLYGQMATTRNVAEKANANIAAIPYYFRSKTGLYNACMHYIVDEIWQELGSSIGNLDALNQTLDKDQAIEAYLNITDNFCQFFLEDPDTLRWSQFIMREHATPTEAYEIFYQRFYKHMQKVKIHLLAICLDASEEDARVRIQSHALFGQVLGFLIARESIVRGLGVDDLNAENILLIRDVVKQTVLAVIGD